MTDQKKNIAQEPSAGYEKAEMDLLKEGLNRSHKERFLMLTQLYKIQQTLKKAKITYTNSPVTK